ncbi:MAG TPA: glycosyltransferase family 4 protein [Bryobacteraceae bacterium]|nr:glycosyltransferase family 4 protein [Bryobacteraceae bacterium]
MKSKRFRIGLVHWAVPPTTGGVESHVVDLARCLTELGCAVTILTGETAPKAVDGVDIHQIPLLNIESLKAIGAQDRRTELKRLFREAIVNRNLQIVHGHNLHHFSAEPANALDELRRELGFQLHHTFHETWPDVLQRRPIYREWDGSYAVSRFVQDECERRLGFRPELRPLGIDTERFQPNGRAAPRRDAFVILHPARLLPWKGVHVSVEALAYLRKRHIPARLILTDTQQIIDWNEELAIYRRRILDRLRETGTAEMVEFRSPSYDEMARLYGEPDVVVYPTIGDEPFGLVPLEAMSMALPVIGSRSGGILETIVDGETGFLIERGDAVGLADCIERLYLDPALRARMGRAGRRRVAEHFSIRTYGAGLLESYSLAGMKRAAGFAER